jgi:hypothetical protein
LWAIGLIYMPAGFVVLGWMLRVPRIRTLATVVLFAVAALSILVELVWDPQWPIAPILMGLPSNVFQAFVLWSLFRSVVWLQDRHVLPSQVLHAYLLFAFLSGYWVFVLFTFRPALFDDRVWPMVVVASAVPAQALVLHLLLHRNWRRHRDGIGRRLLLLRTFGSVKGRERLLDALANSWCRAGRVDLTGATDLAMQTLGSRMLTAFFLQRIDGQLLKTDDEWRARRLHTSLEGDGRYPVNEIYFRGDLWLRAVPELAADSDVVLMDLRGFTGLNHGCAFELRALVHRVPFAKIVLLADRTTDAAQLEEVVQEAWQSTPRGSPNVDDATPRVRVLHVGGRRAQDGRALVRMLYEAAVAPVDLRASTLAPLDGTR